jgi:hypothetical protein
MSSMNQMNEKLNSSLTNKTTVGALSLFLILYAALAAPKLPYSVTNKMDNIYVKIVIVLFIAFLASKNIAVGIIATIALVMTIQSISRNRKIKKLGEIINNSEESNVKDMIKKMNDVTSEVDNDQVDITNDENNIDEINQPYEEVNQNTNYQQEELPKIPQEINSELINAYNISDNGFYSFNEELNEESNLTAGEITQNIPNAEITPESNPQAVPEFNPEAVPEFNPEAVPEFNPQAVSEFNPEAVSEFNPEVVPEFNPQAVPEFNNQAVPEFNNQVLPDLNNTYASVEFSSNNNQIEPELNNVLPELNNNQNVPESSNVFSELNNIYASIDNTNITSEAVEESNDFKPLLNSEKLPNEEQNIDEELVNNVPLPFLQSSVFSEIPQSSEQTDIVTKQNLDLPPIPVLRTSKKLSKEPKNIETTIVGYDPMNDSMLEDICS